MFCYVTEIELDKLDVEYNDNLVVKNVADIQIDSF